jgi:hypothetical protein
LGIDGEIGPERDDQVRTHCPPLHDHLTARRQAEVIAEARDGLEPKLTPHAELR